MSQVVLLPEPEDEFANLRTESNITDKSHCKIPEQNPMMDSEHMFNHAMGSMLVSEKT